MQPAAPFAAFLELELSRTGVYVFLIFRAPACILLLLNIKEEHRRPRFADSEDRAFPAAARAGRSISRRSNAGGGGDVGAEKAAA